MTFFTKDSLAKRSGPFRYLHFLVSGVRYKSYAAWKADGEPNPFVTPTYRHKSVVKSEFLDIFGEYRQEPSRDAM